MFFPKFPSTKLQDVNLDWLLKKIRALRGGTTNQVLAKASDADFDFKWVTGGGGGGGTSDYNDLVNQPQINNVTLIGNLSASDLGLLNPAALTPYRTAANQDTIDAGKQAKITASGMLKGDGDGEVTAAAAGTDYLAPAALNSYRTAANQDTIDAAQNTNIASRAKADEVAIVITGARPSMVVAAGQYVIVRDSMITGITDGLYKASTALSPSTDVIASNLAAVSAGGINSLLSVTKKSVRVYEITDYTLNTEQHIPLDYYGTFIANLFVQIQGYTANDKVEFYMGADAGYVEGILPMPATSWSCVTNCFIGSGNRITLIFKSLPANINKIALTVAVFNNS